jgi:hypothetical protein
VISLLVFILLARFIFPGDSVILYGLLGTLLGTSSVGLLGLFLRIEQNKVRFLAAGLAALAVSNLFCVFFTSLYDPAHQTAYSLFWFDDARISLLLMNALAGIIFALLAYGARSIPIFALAFVVSAIPFGFWARDENLHYLYLLNHSTGGGAFGWDFSGIALGFSKLAITIVIHFSFAVAFGLGVGFNRLIVLKRKDERDREKDATIENPQ